MVVRLAIIACETFKRELESLTEGDPDIAYREYLEFGLHEYPADLKRAVVEKINALEGQVDAVLLGYGVCQSLKDVVQEMRVPTATFEADDCIGVFLTPSGYERERKRCAGTFYATPYFSEMGVEWFRRDIEKKMGPEAAKEIDHMWFLRKLFEGYSRCLYVDTGIGERAHFEALAKDFAKALDLRYESCEATLEMLRDGLARAKQLARNRT